MPLSARSAPIVAASCPSGAPNRATARGCSASERARSGSWLTSLLDDLVGAGEDRLGDRQAERLGGLQVDDQLECGRLLDRQIGWLGPLQDLFDIAGGLPPQL